MSVQTPNKQKNCCPHDSGVKQKLSSLKKRAHGGPGFICPSENRKSKASCSGSKEKKRVLLDSVVAISMVMLSIYRVSGQCFSRALILKLGIASAIITLSAVFLGGISRMSFPSFLKKGTIWCWFTSVLVNSGTYLPPLW